MNWSLKILYYGEKNKINFAELHFYPLTPYSFYL